MSTLAPLFSSLALAAAAALPGNTLQQILADCETRSTALWDRPLCAPAVLVDPTSGAMQTSEPGPSAPLPATRANTSLQWGGRTWIMLLAPLPEGRAERRTLVYHELFHAHQAALGFPANAEIAGHLDRPDARIGIRLEWNALAAALTSDQPEMNRHLAAARAFREERLRDDPVAAAAERALMRHEGLAEYTGVALSGAAASLALSRLQRAHARPSLARNFAYVSGPAWGLLLDKTVPSWRQRLERDPQLDLADLVPVAPAHPADAGAYDRKRIEAEEAAHAEASRAAVADLQHRTEPRRTLRLGLEKMSIDFDPNRVRRLADGSAVYEKVTLRDAWGEARVDGVPLRIVEDFGDAYIPWPLEQGSSLELEAGWRVVRNPEGGFVLEPGH